MNRLLVIKQLLKEYIVVLIVIGDFLLNYIVASLLLFPRANITYTGNNIDQQILTVKFILTFVAMFVEIGVGTIGFVVFTELKKLRDRYTYLRNQ